MTRTSRSPRWILGFIALVLGLGLAASGSSSAYADTSVADLSADPANDMYSPIAWAKEWSEKNQDYDELQQDEPEKYLKESGLVRDGGQRDSLTTEDLKAIDAQWPAGMLNKIWELAAISVSDNHVASRQEGTYAAPEWSPENSDAIAKILGGDSYSTLSPGLKSIVERAAVIITGDNKPPMPDAEWSSWMSAEEKAAYDAMAPKRYDWEQNYTIEGEQGAVVSKCKEDMPSLLTSFCETVHAAADAAGEVANAAGEAVSFASDPLGWLNAKMAEGVTQVFEWLTTLANESTLPDLTLDSWISTYQKGFAAGIVIFAMVLAYQFVRLSRGKIDSSEMLDSLAARTPAYFAGVIFGPPAAQFLIVGAGQLTNSIVQGMTGPNGEATESVKSAISAAGEGNVVGGAIAAMIILLLMMLACFFIFITLCIQTVTIYLSSVVFAIAFAWIVDARRTSGSLKIPFLLIGIIFSRPLLFALLNFGLGFMGDVLGGEGDGAAQTLSMLIMMIVLLSMIALSPALLLQFAPVMPHGGDSTGGAGGASRGVSPYGGGSGGGSAVQSIARPSVASSAAASPSGAGAAGAAMGAPPGGGMAASASSGSSGAAGGSDQSESSGVSKAGTGKSGADSGSVGRILGRSRRHGGGAPSAAAAGLLAGAGGKHTSTGAGSSASESASSGSGGGRARAPRPGLGSRARRGAQKAARPGAEAARNLDGNRPWQ